jgi:hypothetical protein
MRSRTWLIGSILVNVIGGTCLSGCQRDGEAVHVLLKARQGDWARQVDMLRRQQIEMRARFDRLPAAAGNSRAAGPASQRLVEAALDGNRQALADVDVQIQQVGDRVEAALVSGGDAGMKVLDEESARIGGYLRTMWEQAPAAERELASLGRGERRAAGVGAVSALGAGAGNE